MVNYITEERVLKVLIDKDEILEKDNPILTDCGIETVYIGSYDGQHHSLKLISTDFMQPCIGDWTHTGMSFGRWSPATHDIGKIIVDNIDVECIPHESNPNFSLGSYAYADYPEVECRNGGTLDCPEMHGERIMINESTCPPSSTKRSGYIDYRIKTDDMSNWDLMSDAQKWRANELGKYSDALKASITYEYPARSLEHLLKLCELFGRGVEDPTPWKKSSDSTYLMTLRSAMLLGLPADMATRHEFEFEIGKIDKLLDRYYHEDCSRTEGFPTIVALAVIIYFYIHEHPEMMELDKEIVYEMIPSYAYTFNHVATHYANALAFMDENLRTDTLTDALIGTMEDDKMVSVMKELQKLLPTVDEASELLNL